MKFNDVIVKEGFAGDLKDKILNTQGKGQSGGNSPEQKDMSMSLPRGAKMTYRDQLAQKIFLDNFMSDASATISAGLEGGLVRPPEAPKGRNKPPGPESNIDVDGKDEDGGLIPGFQEKFRRMFNPRMVDKTAYGYWEQGEGDHSTERDTWGNKKKPLKQNKIWQQYTIAQLRKGGYPGNPNGMSTQEIKRAYPGWNGQLDERIMESMDYDHAMMNNILESIIDEAPEESGRTLDEFLRDWYGQWMKGVSLSKSKASSDAIIAQIYEKYNLSKNPNKPDIDWNLVGKLGRTAYGASKSVGIKPIGAPQGTIAQDVSSDGIETNIEKFVQQINTEATKRAPLVFNDESYIIEVDPETGKKRWIKKANEEPATVQQIKRLNAYVGSEKGKKYGYLEKEKYNPEKELNKELDKDAVGAELDRPATDEFSMSNYPRGATLQSGGQTYTWVGARWMSKETGRIATRDMAQKLNQYALGQLERGDVGAEDYRHLYKNPKVAESLTFSSLRAEKIALLQTR